MADLIKLPNNGKVPVKNLNTIEISEYDDFKHRGTARTILV